MGQKKSVKVLVVGGEANAGPPLGPALGPLGVNVLQVVNRINELTKEYSGMRVPVKVEVDVDTKQFEVEVGTPTTAALIAKEAGLEKGSGNPRAQLVGNLGLEQIIKIARLKMPQSYAKDIRGAALEVVGACVSMGVSIEGRDPREFLKEVREGKWDEALKD